MSITISAFLLAIVATAVNSAHSMRLMHIHSARIYTKLSTND